jgi:Ca-activated chloride channel family protein
MIVLLALLLLASSKDVALGAPEMLWALWAAPALALFLVWAFRQRRMLLRRFVSGALAARILQGVRRDRQVLKAWLLVEAAALGIFSLANLRSGFTWEDVERRGIDIVVALDVSDSMLVEDAEAAGGLSRLERAKREIRDLIGMLRGDRIALVAFAGEAFLECPLTLDYSAASVFLDTIDTDLIPVKGTALDLALRESLKAFEGGGGDSRAVILITDGEDHSGRLQEVAEAAKLQAVRVFTIGIGRDEGSPIPDGQGGYRRDRKGELILSRLDEPALQKVALATNGRYVRSVTGDVDLEGIYEQGIKATMEDRELGSKRRQRWKNRFQWPLAFCLLLLAAEPLISERRKG